VTANVVMGFGNDFMPVQINENFMKLDQFYSDFGAIGTSNW
jgi:hypothetical protein